MARGKPDRPVSAETLATFRKYASALIEAMIAREFGADDRGGHEAEARMVAAGMDFVIKMLDAAMEFGEVTILEDQLAWAAERLPHDGVSSDDVLHRLDYFKQVVMGMLESTYAQEIAPYLQWMIDRQNEIKEQKRTGMGRSND